MPAPASPPTEAPPAPFDILNPPPPKAENPEDDPNLKMAELIAKRSNRRAGKEEPKEKLTDDEKAGLEATHGAAPGDKKTEDAIARFLNFRTKPAKKTEEKLDEKAAEEKPPEEERQKDEAEPKTIVAKKKPLQQPVLDTAGIVREATTAATTAAMKGLREQQQKPSAAPEDALVDRDRHEYEVAQYMAQTNAKFKNAPQIILDQVKKANVHAARWEAQNPGKVFNPEDDEHADFFDALDAERPWSQEEFEDAKVDRRAEMIAEKKSQPFKDKLEAIEREQAQNSLKGDVQNAQTLVAGALAKSVGDDAFNTITKEGWDAFKNKTVNNKKVNRITAEVLSEVVAAVQPITEALVLLEDPKRRVEFDPKNPAHVQYANFFHEAESRFIGQQDDSGKMFARRADYEKMSAAEMSRHWFLTTQMVGAELVGDASKAIAERIQTRKEQTKLDAEALGYDLVDQSAATKNKTIPSNREEPPPSQNGSPAPFKPASPPSPSGVAIDNTETAPTDPVSRFLQRSSKVLFNR